MFNPLAVVRANGAVWRLMLGFGLLPIVLNSGAASAADRIKLSYGLLERSISAQSLQDYAETGKGGDSLNTYLNSLNETQETQLRSLLQARADLSAVAVSQFLYTDQGQILLRRLGEVIRTESNLPGFYALRSALILAAADPEHGLTLLNVIEKFPVASMRVDLGRALVIWTDLEQMVRQTQDAIEVIDSLSKTEASAATPVSRTSLPDLRSPGVFSWEMRTILLHDKQRHRSFPADLYLPKTRTQQPVRLAPVIVISHGLGSNRSSYAYLAKQLASYGFAVAVPEHPGSNSAQLQALVSGQASQVTPPSEFVNRPLDIKYLLDTLTSLSQSDPTLTGRLNLQNVGVVGQSMGGYTALALAGANLNFQQLAEDCHGNTLNLSLLLQCRAQELPVSTPGFRDPRVKAVIAINPIGSSLFGPTDYAAIHIPVMIVSGSADTVAPALYEQIRPFTWLQTTEKYFLLMQGGTHFSTIDVPDTGDDVSKGEIVKLPPSVVGPDPALAKVYVKAISTAFFSTYIADESAYAADLTAAYAQRISRSDLPIHLVQSLSPTQLAGVIKDPRRSPESAQTPNAL